MATEASQHQYRYRERKRAKGECIYGGCHEPAQKGSYCAPHYDASFEAKSLYKVAHMSDDELQRKRAKHEKSLARIQDEIARRKKLSPNRDKTPER